MIHTGDCVTVMRGMPADSVDAIVTDPPAGIAFMSKHWDRDKGGRTEWVAWMTEVMRECYRVLKPGGYAVVWSLPRTCHWTAWAMEDAGFIIRDQLAHVFASGFPKGKAQLKPAREDWWLARKPGPLRPLGIDACRIEVDPGDPVNGAVWTARAGVIEGSRPASHKKMMVAPDGTKMPATAGEKGRWPSNLLLSDPELFDEPNPYVVGSGATSEGFSGGGTKGAGFRRQYVNGERPDSDLPAQTFGDSGGYSRFFIVPKADRADREPLIRGALTAAGSFDRLGDAHQGQPSAPPFRENGHPTVKPTDLMRHLVRLVTPSGGTVLDCFLGSGSTAIACELEGFPWIGIEKEPEYVAIAEARLNGTQRGLGLDVPAPTSSYRPPKEMPAARWKSDDIQHGMDRWRANVDEKPDHVHWWKDESGKCEHPGCSWEPAA